MMTEVLVKMPRATPDASGSSVRCSCPFHVSDDHRFSQTLWINFGQAAELPYGFFKCFSCGKKGRWNTLARQAGLDCITADPDPELRHIVKKLPQVSEYVPPPPHLRTAIESDFVWQHNGGDFTGDFLSSIGASLMYRTWFADDGYKTADMRVWLPVYDVFGALIGDIAAAPSVPEKGTPEAEGFRKYINARGGWASKHFYGTYEVVQSGVSWVTIVEGPADRLRLLSHGVQSVATLGTGQWNLNKARKLVGMGFKGFLVAMDPDEAGRKAAAQVIADITGLLENPEAVLNIELPPGIDPGKFTPAHSRWLLETGNTAFGSETR